MKALTHPSYGEIHVSCVCGNTFRTRSTLGQDLKLDVCAHDHPAYTGKQKPVTQSPALANFRRRFPSAAASPNA